MVGIESWNKRLQFSSRITKWRKCSSSRTDALTGIERLGLRGLCSESRKIYCFRILYIRCLYRIPPFLKPKSVSIHLTNNKTYYLGVTSAYYTTRRINRRPRGVVSYFIIFLLQRLELRFIALLKNVDLNGLNIVDEYLKMI